MSKVMVSGHNDEALAVPGTDVRELISGLDPDGDGKVFYLKKLVLANEHATEVGVVELYDQDEAVGVAANQRLAPIHVPPGDTVIVNYEDGEAPFVTNLTAGVTLGTFATLSQHASGYLG